MKKKKRHIRKVLAHLGIIVFILWCIFPIYYLIITSLKPRIDVFAVPPIFFPIRISFESMKHVLNFMVYPGLLNSLIIAVGSTVFVILLGSMAGFGFSRLRFRGRSDLMFWILSLRMFPPIVVIIPLFLLFRLMHLVDTRGLMIFLHIGINLPFTVWIMKTFFDELPKEIEEAALIDGCTLKQVFFKIAAPLSKPGIIAASIFSFIFSWNEFIFALIMTRIKAVTGPVVLGSLEGSGGIYWDRIASFAVLLIIPVLIICAFIQKHIVRGLTFGAVKE